jgi:hypothetical protein
LATNADARKTLVFTGTVTGITETGVFISFGAAKDGLLRRTSVKRFDGKRLVDVQLKKKQKLRVMVNHVVLNDDLHRTRISLRVAQQCNLCKRWGHRATECDNTKQRKTCGTCARTSVAVTAEKSSKPDTRVLQVAVLGKCTKLPVPPTARAAMVAFEPTTHFAPCTLFQQLQSAPKAKAHKAEAQAKNFWKRAQKVNLTAASVVSKADAAPASNTCTATPPKEEACAVVAPKGKSKSAKRRARKAAAKTTHMQAAIKQPAATPTLVATVAAALVQLNHTKLAAVLNMVQAVADAGTP